ncbi:MAG: terminase family protein [Labilithrix sp.]
MSQLLPLLDFIPALSPRFARPTHLERVTSRLERALVEPLRLVVSTPPRHAKTETLLHAFPWWLLQQPDAQIAYVSYAAGIAQRKSRKALALARKAGVELDEKAKAKGDWRTGVEDGGVLAFGIDGQATGEGFHVVVADDLVKNRATAESALAREQTAEAVNDDLFTRLEPEGSFIVFQTRWHEDDVPGRLIRAGWEHIRLPALDNDGHALWPERYSAEKLMEIREQVGEYAWASLFQGDPQPRGGALFQNAATYTELPVKYSVRIGVDFAYTAKTRADCSVAVVVASDLEDRSKHFILEVRREQVTAPDFAKTLKELRGTYPSASFTGFIGGTERGTIDFMSSAGISINGVPATTDKFVRAQPAAALWNAGRILVPAAETAMWVTPFLNEVLGFTGVRDRCDDQVDALAGAMHGVRLGEHQPTLWPSRRRRVDHFRNLGVPPHERLPRGGRGY